MSVFDLSHFWVDLDEGEVVDDRALEKQHIRNPTSHRYSFRAPTPEELPGMGYTPASMLTSEQWLNALRAMQDQRDNAYRDC